MILPDCSVIPSFLHYIIIAWSLHYIITRLFHDSLLHYIVIPWLLHFITIAWLLHHLIAWLFHHMIGALHYFCIIIALHYYMIVTSHYYCMIVSLDYQMMGACYYCMIVAVHDCCHTLFTMTVLPKLSCILSTQNNLHASACHVHQRLSCQAQYCFHSFDSCWQNSFHSIWCKMVRFPLW